MNRKGEQASHCLKVIRNSFQFAGHWFRFCDVDMTIVKSEFLYGRAATTFGDYDEQHSVFRLNNATTEILQEVCAENSFGPSKERIITLTFVEGEEKAFQSTHALQLFHFNTRTNDRMFGSFYLYGILR